MLLEVITGDGWVKPHLENLHACFGVASGERACFCSGGSGQCEGPVGGIARVTAVVVFEPSVRELG